MVVHAGQPEGGRIEGCRRLAVRPEGFAVEVQLGVELARPPGLQGPLDLGFRDLEHVDESSQIRGGRDDRSHIEVAVGPAIETVANSGRVGVIDRRVAQSTLNAHRGEGRSVVGEEAGQPDHGVGLQQDERARRVGEIDLASPERPGHIGGNCVDIDLEAQLERCFRTDAGTHAAIRLAGDCLVELQLAAPEILASERVKAENLPSFVQVASGQLGGSFVVFVAVHLSGGRDQDRREQETG